MWFFKNHTLWFKFLNLPCLGVTKPLMKRDPLVEILHTEFDRKRQRNQSYSLRSYSRDLEMDPSNLSKILNNQKKIGGRLRKSLAKKLGFELEEIDSLLTADKDYSQHSLQVFQIVSEWQHYAILELFKLPFFQVTPKAVSQLLGVSLETAEDSLERLKISGLIILDQKSKKWRLAEESSSSILNVATSKAHRDQQRQILEGAINALENIPIEWRSQSSMTMAVDTDKLPEAKEVIKKFRRDIGRLLSSTKNLSEVYQLSVSLYPVTNHVKFKEKKS